MRLILIMVVALLPLILSAATLEAGLRTGLDYYLIEESYESGPNTRLNRITSLHGFLGGHVLIRKKRAGLRLSVDGGGARYALMARASTGSLNAYEEENLAFSYIEFNSDVLLFSEMNSVKIAPFLGYVYRRDWSELALCTHHLRIGVFADFQLYDSFLLDVETGMMPILGGSMAEEKLTSQGTFFLSVKIIYKISDYIAIYTQYDFKKQNIRNTSEDTWKTRVEDNFLGFGLHFYLF